MISNPAGHIYFFMFMVPCIADVRILIIVQRDATQSSLFIILQFQSTCFGCQPHPSSGVHKPVTTASGTGHIFCAATSFQRGQASLTPETCRLNLQNNKETALCCISLENH